VFTGELYPYQDDAALFIQDREAALLAYSMGLGKTPITLAALEGLYSAEDIDTTLVVVPASLKWQWAKAVRKFTDCEMPDWDKPHSHDCVVIDGTKQQRRLQWQFAIGCSSRYVICSYNALRMDWDLVKALPFQAMVCDEATALKNFRGKTAKLIKSLQPRIRIALTGTPVENRPEELYSIMQWVDKEVLGRWDYFDKSFIVRNSFGGVLRYKNLDLLHERLSKAMIRKSRFDPDVAPYLPDVMEVDIPVELDAASRRAYRVIEKDLLAALEALGDSSPGFNIAEYYAGGPALSSSIRGKVMARMQVMRMFLDDPELVAESARLAENTGNSGCQYASELLCRPGFALPPLSPKLDALKALIRRICAEDDSKIIVFTEYRRMQRIIEAHLKGPYALEYVLYHGGMSASEKAVAADRFQDDPNCRIFLSTDAGGYGLDLPAAKYLINFDLPYSGGKQKQRNARHVRASSQHKKVFVANLVCADTIEERVLKTLNLRARVSDAIVDGRGNAVIENDVDSLSKYVSR